MRLLLRVLLMIAVTGLAVLHGADTPPHVVVFLADDLGWEDCKTPNMTRLGREGMTLTHAFVASPSCAPSRAALLTGLSCAHNGAMFNHSRPGAIIKKWPKFFSEIGYETAAIGKTAHYGQVKEYGFDHASHFTYHDDTCIDAACTWLEARKSERPLCLIVGTNWPHVPWPKATRVEKAPPANLIDTAETRAAYAQYLTAVEKADADLGKVYDTARRTLGSNVLFLFTSDHGAQLPFGKWNCYDQ
ncbi:MAG TPA: sulfatase-like hydrolase/transferase, partial [Prosthecobacter sp.]|nr:sulfatase-like hydrolase/transferase [Prosthecobacter sp.]